MPAERIFGVVILLAAAALFVWFAVVSKNKTLKLNYLVGYRTTVILTNEETWRVAHFAAWPWTAGSAAVYILAGLSLFLPFPDEAVGAIIIAGLVLGLGAMFVGAHKAQQAAKEVLEKTSKTKTSTV